MAVEQEEEEGKESEVPEKKKSGVKLILILVIAVLLLGLIGVGGFIAYRQVTQGGDQEGGKSTADKAKEGDAAKIGDVIAIDPFIVNLSDDSGKRYLKVSMQFELGDPLLAEELTNKMPQIKDTIITVLSDKASDDVLTVGGKRKLKEQILTRVNIMLKSGMVKNIFFVEFVIQ
ncbi:MAG: hypothetical protein IEMM0002_0155 [bacterium]|nr:MAG: hypothetical protein IEMM0002_0155 [bacterium]